ncbi:MAG: PAS domain-containing protein [Polyangiaceae bacterium]|nr:PAS domain-containing protein [Polyangiaceae bacterium]
MDSLYVVGIGASAGGLEPLERFFGAIPRSMGVAFVVVQHLSPDFKSMMHELLARRTTLPITIVEDGVVVEPDHIYLIPPKKEMIISGGRLRLRDRAADHELTLPIDIFMRSLARDCGSRAIAVILSGGGSDGSRGVCDVHEAGGLVVCQDESTALFDGMPRSARDTGIVDRVAPAEKMPELIIEHIRTIERGAVAKTETAESPRGLNAIFRLLLGAYQIDFSHYKPTTVQRRIERRLEMTKADLDTYVDRVRADPSELDTLYRDLLIGVTGFFRDKEAFDELEREVVPKILDAPKRDEIRLWIPGCATGEEAYSHAMLFHEHMAKRGDKRPLRIFATDVHPGSLERASRGFFEEATLRGLSQERLERYFVREGSGAWASNELRQLIVFAQQNLIRDAPFTRLDLVSCRNVLIYLQPLVQKRSLALFHFALRAGGYLFLGPSETPGSLADDFETINQQWRLYQKQRERSLLLDGSSGINLRGDLRSAASVAPAIQALSQKVGIYEAIIEQALPPSFLVNDKNELVHTFNGAGRWVGVKDGKASLDVRDLVGPDLRTPLTTALSHVFRERVALAYKGLPLRTSDSLGEYRLSVQPIYTKAAANGYALISLEPHQTTTPAEPDQRLDFHEVTREQVEVLESELRFTRESLQATIEALEASNEELQSTNEELLSSNEELQSTNEELHSVNEELYTVNSEYQKKIAQLTELTNDIDNLLLSTDVGTIFLDGNLRIRKFTPRIARAFNLLPQDLGRPIGAFANSLNYTSLPSDLDAVLTSRRPVERELQDEQGNWFFVRVLPYRSNGATDGVVVTFIDINGLKEAESALFRERYLFDSLMESVPDAIYFKDGKGRFVRVNTAAAIRLGLRNPVQAVGARASDFVPPDVAWPLEQADVPALQGSTQPYRLEEHPVLSGEKRWFMTTRQPLRDKCGEVVGACAVVRDVTDQKRAEDESRVAVERRDHFLAMLSHELRNPLGAIVTAAKLLEEDGVERQEVEILARQTRQMARLLDDLLEVTRLTHDKIEIVRQTLDVRPIAREAAAALLATIHAKGVTFEARLEERPIVVDADPARLQQIIVNVVGNAVKYTSSGGRVWLSVESDADSAVIVVRDDGIGIDPGTMNDIFDLFVQGRSTLARTEGGLGVGLALVRALVNMHGGTVSAQSEGVGRGSTFTIRLPLSCTTDNEPRPPSRRPESTLPSRLRVVAVDDNADACQLLTTYLERLGCDVRCAYNGEEALELIESFKPRVAILDIGLPGVDGYELAKQLRGRRLEEPLLLVALTGYGRRADRDAAIRAGFDEHLVKPLQPEDLELLLRERVGEDPGGPKPASEEQGSG